MVTRPSARKGRLGVAAIGVLVALVLVLGVGQLVIPGIVARRLTNSLSTQASGVRVSLSAVPAVKLLFGYADRVSVNIGTMTASRGHVGDLLARTAKQGTLDATVGTLDTDGFVLKDVALRKRGNALTGVATVTRSAIAAALPSAITLTPRSAGASGLTLMAKLRVLGREVDASALVEAQDGKIVVSPTAPVLSILRVTVFDSRSVSVDSVGVVAHGDSYAMRASGHYR